MGRQTRSRAGGKSPQLLPAGCHRARHSECGPARLHWHRPNGSLQRHFACHQGQESLLRLFFRRCAYLPTVLSPDNPDRSVLCLCPTPDISLIDLSHPFVFSLPVSYSLIMCHRRASSHVLPPPAFLRHLVLFLSFFVLDMPPQPPDPPWPCLLLPPVFCPLSPSLPVLAVVSNALISPHLGNVVYKFNHFFNLRNCLMKA